MHSAANHEYGDIAPEEEQRRLAAAGHDVASPPSPSAARAVVETSAAGLRGADADSRALSGAEHLRGISRDESERMPSYRFVSDAGSLGDPESPLQLTCAPWPRPLPAVQVADARGCDVQPLDPGTCEDQLTLRSAVWADQPDRFAQLDAALAIAVHHPPVVERADALAWLQRIEPDPGVATIVYHSVVEQYLTPDSRAQLTQRMRELITRASANAPVAWLSLERPQDQGAYGRAELRLALSPDPERYLLGFTSFHGSPVALTDNRCGGGVLEPAFTCGRTS